MEYGNEIEKNKEVSIMDWVITLILTAIPLVGLIMLFVWAFSDSTPKSKANWAKASLIMMLVGIVLAILFWSSIAALAVAVSAME